MRKGRDFGRSHVRLKKLDDLGDSPCEKAGWQTAALEKLLACLRRESEPKFPDELNGPDLR